MIPRSVKVGLEELRVWASLSQKVAKQRICMLKHKVRIKVLTTFMESEVVVHTALTA